MDFEQFRDLLHRIVRSWYAQAKIEIIDMKKINTYLQENPMTAKATKDNEEAYEKLMDIRCNMVVSFCIYIQILHLNTPLIRNIY